MGARRHHLRLLAVGALLAVGVGTAACATGSTSFDNPATSHHIVVVAAENMWGSVAASLGGAKVQVVSLITNPNADPHSYEPTASDARAVAMGNLDIANGVGYDPWMSRLIAADGVTSANIQGRQRQLSMDLGAVVGEAPGDNPHLWYNPADVTEIAAAITRQYQRLDPGDSSYFQARLTTFLQRSLAPYHALIAEIRSHYAHVKVGASESIFAQMAPALGVDLITPPSFLRAISEGTDPTVADLSTIERQISDHEIQVYVLNTQNETPDVTAQVRMAQAEHLPIVAITETLAPATASFVTWQTSELRALADALAQARTDQSAGATGG